MKNDFERVYQTFIKMQPSEMRDLCFQSLITIKKVCEEEGFNPQSHIKLVAGVVEMFLKEDLFLTDKEKDFIKMVFTGTEYEEEINSVLNDDINQGKMGWDVVIDRLPIAGKDAVCMLGMCLIAADRKITPEEKELFEIIYK